MEDVAAGTRRIYRLNPVALAALPDQLDTYWQRALAGYAEAAETAAELREIAYELEDVSTAGGEDAVRAHLQRAAESRIKGSGRTNHWRAVAYRALADSSWYCSGGFSFS